MKIHERLELNKAGWQRHAISETQAYETNSHKEINVNYAGKVEIIHKGLGYPLSKATIKIGDTYVQ